MLDDVQIPPEPLGELDHQLQSYALRVTIVCDLQTVGDTYLSGTTANTPVLSCMSCTSLQKSSSALLLRLRKSTTGQ